MKIAIITGASSGLGREFVRLLAQNRKIDEIWALARSSGKLERLAKLYGNVRPYTIDLSDRQQIGAFEQYLKAELKQGDSISVLINNAGFAKFCAYDDITTEETLNMIDLNIAAVVAMGLLCIPYMHRGSHILNIASQAAFQPLPYQNVYSSTKAFLRNYTRALNVELKNKGITATAVCPGWMKTGLIDRGRTNAVKATVNFAHMTSAAPVAKKALLDAAKGKDMSVYSAYVKTCHLIAKLLPQSVMMKLWLLQQKL